MNIKIIDLQNAFNALNKNTEIFTKLDTPILKNGGNLIEIGKSGIYIKKKNRGKFTESAKRAGKSVQEHAKDVLNDPNATPLQKKRANFARNAKKFKHKNGGKYINKEKFIYDIYPAHKSKFINDKYNSSQLVSYLST